MGEAWREEHSKVPEGRSMSPLEELSLLGAARAWVRERGREEAGRAEKGWRCCLGEHSGGGCEPEDGEEKTDLRAMELELE